MVGEFPELQGVMGGYYARHDGEDGEVAQAVAEHYQPKGPTDPVPESATGAAVALADKLDTLAGFFAIDERPTGSGDPFALRRAALGVIRIIRDRGLRLPLRQMIDQALAAFPTVADDAADALFAFLIERLRVQLRAEGARHDVLTSVLGAGPMMTRCACWRRIDVLPISCASKTRRTALIPARSILPCWLPPMSVRCMMRSWRWNLP